MGLPAPDRDRRSQGAVWLGHQAVVVKNDADPEGLSPRLSFGGFGLKRRRLQPLPTHTVIGVVVDDEVQFLFRKSHVRLDEVIYFVAYFFI